MASQQSLSGIESGKRRVNGVDLYYERAGRGSRAVLLVPGALGTTLDFRLQLENMDGNLVTVVTFDPRGYGKSRPPDREISQDFLKHDADDARALMLALGHDKFSLVGSSDGGMVAIILAATYQDNVEKLITCGATAYVPESELSGLEELKDISKVYSESSLATQIAIYGKEYFEKTWSEWCDTTLRFYHERGGNVCIDEAKRVSCPTLILQGDKDEYVAMEHGEFLHRTIKGSRLKKWPDGIHALQEQFPHEFNKVVQDFVTETSNE